MGKAWPALDIHVGHPNAAGALGAPAPSCDPQLHDLVLAELDDFQPTAIQEPDDTPHLRAFFTSTQSRDAAARALMSSFGSHLFVESIAVEDDDWAARSQAQLRAITVGRIVIAPPWDTERGREEFSRASAEIPSRPLFVTIQPSMGFGTGHHATTRLILKMLQKLTLEGQSALDIGCGSGVLAITAIKLGARSSVGIDVDPDALENARENAALNDIANNVEFALGDFRNMRLSADIVMANLTGALLEKSATVLVNAVTPGGSLIVSGFMDSERTTVVPALEKYLSLRNVDGEEEWLCALLQRQR